uniref:ELYS-bb domain-containing protein n=1 Tax=Strongyloides papillosus TaxID=174720 RepID=A0A0N5BPM9_STREA
MSLDFHRPSFLQQRLVEVESERCNLSTAFGLSEYKSGSPRIGKYLYDSEGKCKYFVVAVEEYLLLYNTEQVCGEPRKRVEYCLGKGARIHDCAFMYLEDNSEGLVVGATTVNEAGVKCYGLYLLSAGREAIILDAMAFVKDCKKVFVVYDELHRDELKKIDPAFHNHPHLIMVGMEDGAGYLTHFKNTSKSNALRDRPPTRPTSAFNVLRGFRDKTNTFFTFDASGETTRLKLSEVEVTSISYVHSCRCLLIGFNFGGVVSINLLTQQKIKIRISRGEIRAMQVQEPDDDPRPTSYVWVGSLIGGRLTFTLISLMFYTDPSDPSIVDMNKVALSKRLEFEADKFSHFLALKGITRERTLKADNTTRLEDIHKKDTTLMLFSWINITSKGISLEGALFDLNMYYYKRMVSQIRDDGTYAKQCPLISRFSMNNPNGINFAALLDINLDPESLYRGKSDLIENVDQFFYPSTYGFELHTFTKNAATVLSCEPIQFQFFERLTPLKEHLNEPAMAIRCLTALGFISVKESSQITEHSAKCSAILSTLLHNFSGNLIIQMIKDSTVTEKYLVLLIDWLYTEIQKCVDDFQRIVSKLFEENSEELYSAQITKVNHYIGVFEMMKEIIVAMKAKDLSDSVRGQLYVKEVVIDTFLLYSRLMNVFVEVGLFPITPDVIELHKSLEDIHNKRVLLSRRKLYKLDIEKLLDLLSKTDLECVEKLYPPRNPAILIDLIVAPEIKIIGKLRLISYYALDIGFLRNNNTFIDKVQYNVAFFYKEKDPIDFFEIKKCWREDSIELEDYKENIFTIRPENLDYDYKNNLTPRVVERICQKVYMSDGELKDLHDYLLKQPHGLFIWNYIAVKREEFSMIEPININVLSNVPDEWKALCETSKNLYEKVKGNSILWRYKMPSLYNKKSGLKNETFCNLTHVSIHGKSQNDSELVADSSKIKSIDTIVDKDYLDHHFAAQRYENLLKTPMSASRWTRVSRLTNINKSPPMEQPKQIQPTSIMKSQERVSRLRPGMKIGSRIRFNLPDTSSIADNTAGDSTCSTDNNDSMNSTFNGVFHIEKSDEQTEFDDVKCVYKAIIQEKIEEQMSRTVLHEDGRVTVMETQTDEEMLMSDLENSPAKTGVDLINHMEERSKNYNIELPTVVLVQAAKEKLTLQEDNTPVLKRRKSSIIKKTLAFSGHKGASEINQDDKVNVLKRNSPFDENDEEDSGSAKKTRINEEDDSGNIKETRINDNEDEVAIETDISTSTLRRSARIHKHSVEPEPPSVPTTRSKNKRGTTSRETSVDPDIPVESKTGPKRGTTSRENSIEPDTPLKTRTKRVAASRETSAEPEASATTKTRSKRVAASRETSVDPEVPATTKTRPKRGAASREVSVEPDVNSTTKTRPKRGAASREVSVEPDVHSTTRTRTKRGTTSRETSVEPEVPATPKSRTRRGSSCEQETELRRSTRLRRTPSKEFESSTKKGSKSPSRLPTILETNAVNSERQK